MKLSPLRFSCACDLGLGMFARPHCDLNFLSKPIHEAEKLLEREFAEAAAQKCCGLCTINSEHVSGLRFRPAVRLYKSLQLDHYFCLEQLFLGFRRPRSAKTFPDPIVTETSSGIGLPLEALCTGSSVLTLYALTMAPSSTQQESRR